jgi:hypothetical protein
VESNGRLTASNAAVLLVLLAAEGFTILGIRQMITPHVFIGMVLIPPVLGWHRATGCAARAATSAEPAPGSG